MIIHPEPESSQGSSAPQGLQVSLGHSTICLLRTICDVFLQPTTNLATQNFLCVYHVSLSNSLFRLKMPASKPVQPGSRDIWHRHAPEIRRLYQKHTVDNVRRIMEKESGFPEMA